MDQHQHLKRLSQVWTSTEVYFITTCTAGRRRILDRRQVFEFLLDEFSHAEARHGWRIGQFLIMPDHVHFFCSPVGPERRDLSDFMAALKQWSAKRILKALDLTPPFWQAEFFDHLLRSEASYHEKLDYVRCNPVRAGLCASPDEWPWRGECGLLTF
jgi:putative transposase